ncbi:hypothetical protein OF83DRAFT_1097876 [Amylostereum chailletii]|nr:hypothetical protein OF83DRAFT_1097876 [Amylostereum chailletii]
MLDIGSIAFDEVSDEEKRQFEARIKETGTYLGYKLPQYWVCSRVLPVLCLSTAHLSAAYLEWCP